MGWKFPDDLDTDGYFNNNGNGFLLSELGNNLSADIYLNDDAGFHIPPNIYNITDQTVVQMTDADGIVSTQTFFTGHYALLPEFQNSTDMALYQVEVTENDDGTTSYTIPDNSIPINVPFSLVADPSSDFNTSNTIVAEEVTFDFDLGGDEGPDLDTNDGDGPAPDGPILTISVVEVDG